MALPFASDLKSVYARKQQQKLQQKKITKTVKI